MKLKKEVPLNDPETINELMAMFVEHFEYSIEDIESYDELSAKEKEIIPKWLFDRIVEEPEKVSREEIIKQRKKANFKILTRLGAIIDQFPYLRFQQLLMNFRVTELGTDKFYEESVETLTKLNQSIREFKINQIYGI